MSKRSTAKQEQPAEENTLDDDLREALNAAEESEEVVAVDEVEEEATEEAVAEDVTEEDEAVDDEDQEEVEEVEAVEEEEEEGIEPPQHWAAIDREIFSNQPREVQTWMLDRHKAMEGDYTRKMQEIAPIRKNYEAIDEVLRPYRNEFSQAGLDDAGAVRQLASWHASLKSNPTQAIHQLAQMYGADLTQADEQPYVDPAIQKVTSELEQMKQQQARQQQEAQQSVEAEQFQKIQAFEEARDESGNLAHPHFRAVYDDMVKLFQSGMATELDDAYTKATRMRSDLSIPQKRETATKQPDQKAKVRKAKKAATGVKSSGAAVKNGDMSLHDEIASHFNRLN